MKKRFLVILFIFTSIIGCANYTRPVEIINNNDEVIASLNLIQNKSGSFNTLVNADNTSLMAVLHDTYYSVELAEKLEISDVPIDKNKIINFLSEIEVKDVEEESFDIIPTAFFFIKLSHKMEYDINPKILSEIQTLAGSFEKTNGYYNFGGQLINFEKIYGPEKLQYMYYLKLLLTIRLEVLTVTEKQECINLLKELVNGVDLSRISAEDLSVLKLYIDYSDLLGYTVSESIQNNINNYISRWLEELIDRADNYDIGTIENIVSLARHFSISDQHVNCGEILSRYYNGTAYGAVTGSDEFISSSAAAISMYKLLTISPDDEVIDSLREYIESNVLFDGTFFYANREESIVESYYAWCLYKACGVDNYAVSSFLNEEAQKIDPDQRDLDTIFLLRYCIESGDFLPKETTDYIWDSFTEKSNEIPIELLYYVLDTMRLYGYRADAAFVQHQIDYLDRLKERYNEQIPPTNAPGIIDAQTAVDIVLNILYSILGQAADRDEIIQSVQNYIEFYDSSPNKLFVLKWLTLLIKEYDVSVTVFDTIESDIINEAKTYYTCGFYCYSDNFPYSMEATYFISKMIFDLS